MTLVRTFSKTASFNIFISKTADIEESKQQTQLFAKILCKLLGCLHVFEFTFVD